MSKSFLKGMGMAMNLFPQERDINLLASTYSDEEAFKKDLEQVGLDMYFAIRSIEQSKDFHKHNGGKEIGHSTKR